MFRHLVLTLSLLASFAAAANDVNVTSASGIVATVEGRPIHLEEVDTAGGRNIYDMAHELYKARVQALYGLLSAQLFELEAAEQGIDVEQLRKQEIASKALPVTDADIVAYLDQNPRLSRENPRDFKRVELYLRVKANDDQKKRYLRRLFAKYDVHVALDAPPPPPAEEIFGDVPPTLGRMDAPIEVVSFSDYQCPYCRQMSDTLAQLYERYPDDVKIVYRHFPRQGDSQKLAEAALCAGAQGHFLEYHEALFSRPGITSAQVTDIAASIQLDQDEFEQCFNSMRFTTQITDDIKEGERLNIRGTPTNFVNGIRVPGAAKLPAMVAKVEAILSEQRKASARPATASVTTDQGG
jgi:protein-disulfide isomerase